MAKVVRALLVVALISVAACGVEESESGVETVDSALEETGGESADAGDGLVPPECLDSDEAFNDCYDQGLIPDDCFDAEGFFIDSCVSGGGAAGPSPELGPDAVTSGFDPAVHGFGFANYGSELGAVGLTEAEMQRMFGDEVCANLDDGCTLIPPAREWMERQNEAMGGGHCEGMAVLSKLFYSGLADPSEFGSETVFELEIEGNDPLQREIAYWWATQATDPGDNTIVAGSPSEVLDTLIDTFSQGADVDDSWTIGVFKRDGSGGHAVTPYAVEEFGDDVYHVYVYDNNHPGQGRTLTIDRTTDTWEYEASTNPSVEADLYEGDADSGTLSLHLTSPRLQFPQLAAFGEAEPQGFAAVAAGGSGGVEIWLEGEANLLITADDGRRVGWLEDGSFVNEIDGASTTSYRFGVAVWDVDQEPVYFLPDDIGEFSITIDGSQLDEQTVSTVTMIGADFVMMVEDVVLDAGQSDFIGVSIRDGDYFAMNYQSDYSDSPNLWFGIVTDEADYEFIARGSDIEPGGAFNVVLDFLNGDFILDTTGQTEYGVYELLVARIDDEGESVFVNDAIELEPDDVMYVNFFEWEGVGSPMFLDFDYGGDGTFDESVELEDLGGSYDEFVES